MSRLACDGKRKAAEIEDDSPDLGSPAKRLCQDRQGNLTSGSVTTLNQYGDYHSQDVAETADDRINTSTHTAMNTADKPSLDLTHKERATVYDQSDGSHTAQVDFAALADIDDISARKVLRLAGIVPPLWATARGGLCETAPYFRAVQGGNHTADAATHGLLFDAGGSSRDYLDTTVIIAPAGGGKKLDSKTKTMTRQEDQDKTARNYKFLSKTQEEGIAIGVVIGNRYPQIKLPYTYCVIGQYQVTDIWSERFSNGEGKAFAEWMVRFERIGSSQKPWFAGFVGPDDISHTFAPGQFICPSRQCTSCLTTSKHIYKQGWVCLNHECPEHFLFTITINGQPQRQILKSEQVQYNMDFINERTDSTTSIKPEHIKTLTPPLPTMADQISFGTEQKFKKGIACPKCHCGSRRINWEKWVCEGENCDFAYALDTRLYPLSEVAKETLDLKRANKLMIGDSIDHWYTKVAGYEAQVFNLPSDMEGKICGTVFVLRATTEICAKAGGPDDMFIAMQREGKNLKLERKPVRNSGTRIEALTSHFCSNWGAPYKFGVTLKSTGFAEAPKPILDGVAQLSWAQRAAIEATAKKFATPELKEKYSRESMSLKSEAFNEMLLLGYFESCKIDYHDDGEKELGPTVATLSLGSPSLMSFRPKTKSSIGTFKTTQKAEKHPVIDLPLNHGDIVIMHGTEIHKLYDHKVLPYGKLRFAMTSRYVRPELMKTPEERDKAIAMGTMPAGIERAAYMGTDSGVDTGEDTADAPGNTEPTANQDVPAESSLDAGPDDGVFTGGQAMYEPAGSKLGLDHKVTAESSLHAVSKDEGVDKTLDNEEQPGIPTPDSFNHEANPTGTSPGLDF